MLEKKISLGKTLVWLLAGDIDGTSAMKILKNLRI